MGAGTGVKGYTKAILMNNLDSFTKGTAMKIFFHIELIAD